MIELSLTKVKISRKIILQQIDLKVKSGQVLAVLGRNGTGKSTLLNAITDHPSVSYDGSVQMDAPVFMGFQKPVEVPEISTIELLQYMHYLANDSQVTADEFFSLYAGDMKELDLTSDLLTRPLNSEVSGGENKRIELLQMAVINPKTLLLDEVDTGLDLDNQILIGNFLAKYIKVHAPAVIIVTHNMKFLSYFNCNHVVVLADGQVTCTGGKPLIKKIETKGFNGL